MLINAQHLSLSKAGRKLVNDVSVAINKGQIIGLIGPNGAGKTSLLKLLANVQKADSGSYEFAGKPINQYKEKELAKQVAYLAQQATAHWPLTVRKVIELGRLPYQRFGRDLSAQDQHIVLKAAKQTDVEHLLDRVITSLSGGEQTRVFLARLFAAEPNVIFADEPIAALDPYHQLHVMEILREHAQRGGTVVVVMHDINLASRFCDQLILMNHGKIVKFGKLNDLLQDNVLANTYGIDLRLFCEEDTFSVIPWARHVNHAID